MIERPLFLRQARIGMRKMDEHKEIWLEPQCDECRGHERSWCYDNVWGECDECGAKPVKYVIAATIDTQADTGAAQHKQDQQVTGK
jgi:hypothetical protein